jgi:polysaccharide biosynthesis transport protein
MELVEYIRIFRRWFWLILLMAFVAGGIGFITRSGQQPVYQAQTEIIIGSILQNPDPDSTDIRAPVDLTATYSQIIRTNDLLQATVNALNLSISVGELQDMISTSTIVDTSLLVITVTYTDPILAADIANELAHQLVLKSPTNLTAEQESQIEIANNQISTLTTQLDVLLARLEQIDTELEELAADSTDRSRLEEQRTTLVDQLNQATANIAQFTDIIARYQQRTGALNIIETATIPSNPIGSSSFTSLLLYAMVGGMLASGVALLIEYLNDTLQTAEEVTQVLGLSILGVISRFSEKNTDYPEQLISNKDMVFTRSTEEYRSLRTNLIFAGSKEKPQVLVVTSPGPQEGKSVTVSNIAVSMAMADLRVILIDADLRRPKIHTIFGLNNELGITTLLLKNSPNGDINDTKDHSWKHCLQDPAGIPNLRVITSGFLPDNPTELLGSMVLKRWLDVFCKHLDVDVILFDTPPCLMITDSVVLTTTASAQAVLVVRANETRRNEAIKAKERFSNVGIELTGVLLNGVDPRDDDYYGYGYYASDYYKSQ